MAKRIPGRDDVATRHVPVRCTEGSLNTLHVFALADHAEPFGYSRSPKDPRRYSTVSVLSACEQFVHSGLDAEDSPMGINPKGAPFYWRGDLDLTRVHRRALPVLTYDTADALTRDIEHVFEAHGAVWA